MAANQEVQIDQESFRKLRQQDLQKLRDAGLDPYPHKFCPDPKYTSMTIDEFRQIYDHQLNSGDHLDGDFVFVIGRVYLIRTYGKKLAFIDLHQEGVKVQIMANLGMYQHAEGASTTNDHFKLMTSVIRIGDQAGFAGIPTRTKTGELSLIPHFMQLLAPCMRMLPPRTYEDEEGNTVSGLLNQEIRYRQRYLDLMINEENLAIFQKRSRIMKAIRHFFDVDLGLTEVDTPILNPNVGGATAKPFATHSADYDCPLFMRVAPELYLKMLIVGGFRGVYEIGRQFRNEGNDLTHNSEFTSLEYYIQNCDYHDLMQQCEKMLEKIVQTVNGSLTVAYDGKNIDFTPPFKKLDMLDTLEEQTGLKFPADLSTDEAREFLDKACVDRHVDCSSPRTTARLLDKLVGKYVESLCINPTFIVGHPQIMSPLAKWDRNGSCRTERFELFVNCTELANAYTELNDPEVQMARFASQVKDKEMGDDEAMPVDTNFVKALEYGLMPTGGFGMGIDRLVMFLTGKTSIREVVLFPTMKPV